MSSRAISRLLLQGLPAIALALALACAGQASAESRVSVQGGHTESGLLKRSGMSVSAGLRFVVVVPPTVSVQLDARGVMSAASPSGQYAVSCASACIPQPMDDAQVAAVLRVPGLPQVQHLAAQEGESQPRQVLSLTAAHP